MNKIGFVFPGQGVQCVGMGKDFYEEFSIAREMMNLASRETGLDIPALCFEENSLLSVTEYTQAALLAVSVGILKVLEEMGIKADIHAGLSLGEYGALTASGALTPEDAFGLVRKRGIYMQEAVPTGGAMAAVLGVEAGLVEKICTQTEGMVSVANYNCPGQIVITGEEGAVFRAGEALKIAGARRIAPLNVSGPFHSPMLFRAGERLEEALKEVEIHPIQIPYITNVTAEPVTDASVVKELLKKQVSSPVLWQQSMERMIAQGVDTFIEIGPGKTLTGFLRKINRNVKTLNVAKTQDLERVRRECL